MEFSSSFAIVNQGLTVISIPKLGATINVPSMASHMLVKVRFIGKRFCTNYTFIRAFSRVGSFMSFKVGGFVCCVRTEGALVFKWCRSRNPVTAG